MGTVLGGNFEQLQSNNSPLRLNAALLRGASDPTNVFSTFISEINWTKLTGASHMSPADSTMVLPRERI